MTPEIIITIVISLPAVLAALAALVTSLRNGREIEVAKRTHLKDSLDKDRQLGEIHELVNNRLTNAETELATAKGEIAYLRSQVSRLSLTPDDVVRLRQEAHDEGSAGTGGRPRGEGE
jgi:hypothetical protein